MPNLPWNYWAAIAVGVVFLGSTVGPKLLPKLSAIRWPWKREPEPPVVIGPIMLEEAVAHCVELELYLRQIGDDTAAEMVRTRIWAALPPKPREAVG